MSLSAADPLNLLGLITPGPRLAAIAANRFVLSDGLPLASLAGGEVRCLEKLDERTHWKVRKAVLRSGAYREASDTLARA